MPQAWASALMRLAATLAVGALLGAYFGDVVAGMFVAALVALAATLYPLFRLEQELRLRRPITVPWGTGIWPQVLARVDFLRQRIKHHKTRYRGLLREIQASTNALPDGVVSLDASNEIKRYNGAARRLIGLKRKRDRGQRIDNLLRHPEFVEYLRRGPTEKPCVIPSPVVQGNWLSVRLVPYAPDLRLLLIRDITEQTELARMRRDFVANASHELRTPLTVIAGYLEALADDPSLPADLGRPVAEMRVQADRMRDIITDLLELSRLDSAARARLDDEVDVGGLIAASIDELAPAGGPIVTADVTSRRRVVGNTGEIQSVVSNLLANAIRHTPVDGRVRVGWHDAPDGGAELVVADTGEGIAESDIPRITERFYRVSRGRSRSDGGVGLGLAIVKHVLSRHEAVLTIESVLGRGSTFRCAFPAARVAARGPAGNAA